MKVSVVIPNYNGRKILEKSLPRVKEACVKWSKKDWEIIIVDDASTDDSVGFIKNEYPEVRLLIHEKNKRFSETCNDGVRAAKGEVVVLLNSDVQPRVDFLKPLIDGFSQKNVFSIGALEEDFHNGKKLLSGRSGGEFFRGFLRHWREKDQMQTETFWTAGGSMAVDRKKWLEIGGMDVLFRPAYWEDIDLSWRARKKGWKVLFEPKSVVYHHHEMTNKTALGEKRMKTYSYKNQFLFIWKNGSFVQLIQHLLWLPYHFGKAIVSRDKVFIFSFFLALFQLPEVIKRRL